MSVTDRQRLFDSRTQRGVHIQYTYLEKTDSAQRSSLVRLPFAFSLWCCAACGLTQGKIDFVARGTYWKRNKSPIPP